MNDQLLYQVALTQIPSIGAVHARQLIQAFGSAEEVFKASTKKISTIEYIGETKAAAIKAFTDFSVAEEELGFIEKYKIQPIFFTDELYPKKLFNCYDAPVMLYYRGNADLNHQKIISIIGTRTNTDYGKQQTEKIVEELKEHNVLIVSGLAFGIDAIAHKAAVNNSLPTVGVLAHGLDTIYPPQHKSLAKDMLQHGGLLTEFISNTKADRHNFPKRNRIVAGMADATIVIETAIKGGSMITAELAYNYNRDVFALPGRISDSKSAGSNYLIQHGKAKLFSSVKDLAEILGWQRKNKKATTQKTLFIELSADEKKITEILDNRESVHIDEIFLKSGLSSSMIAAAMLNLELQNIVIALPGKMYRLS